MCLSVVTISISEKAFTRRTCANHCETCGKTRNPRPRSNGYILQLKKLQTCERGHKRFSLHERPLPRWRIDFRTEELKTPDSTNIFVSSGDCFFILSLFATFFSVSQISKNDRDTGGYPLKRVGCSALPLSLHSYASLRNCSAGAPYPSRFLKTI